MNTIILNVEKREQQKVSDLKSKGLIPAIIYGKNQDSLKVSVKSSEFNSVLKQAGESTLIDLKGVDNDVTVVIKDVAFSPLGGAIEHVDFYAVTKGQKMTTNVSLEFVNEAPVEALNLGVVNRILYEVSVDCIPSKLPQYIEVDLSTLKTLEDKFLVKDLKLPEGVTINNNLEDSIAVVGTLTEAEESQGSDEGQEDSQTTTSEDK